MPRAYGSVGLPLVVLGMLVSPNGRYCNNLNIGQPASVRFGIMDEAKMMSKMPTK